MRSLRRASDTLTVGRVYLTLSASRVENLRFHLIYGQKFAHGRRVALIWTSCSGRGAILNSRPPADRPQAGPGSRSRPRDLPAPSAARRRHFVKDPAGRQSSARRPSLGRVKSSAAARPPGRRRRAPRFAKGLGLLCHRSRRIGRAGAVLKRRWTNVPTRRWEDRLGSRTPRRGSIPGRSSRRSVTAVARQPSGVARRRRAAPGASRRRQILRPVAGWMRSDIQRRFPLTRSRSGLRLRTPRSAAQ